MSETIATAAAAPDLSFADRVLELDAVTMQFGGVTALEDVSLYVDSGEIVGLIGPNGAGKTTVFNVVTGVYKPTHGDIRFLGASIAGLAPPPHHRARHRAAHSRTSGCSPT